MNLTRTRAARILMVGATLGMTIGLASSGLTAAAADDPEPPTTQQVAPSNPSTENRTGSTAADRSSCATRAPDHRRPGRPRSLHRAPRGQTPRPPLKDWPPAKTPAPVTDAPADPAPTAPTDLPAPPTSTSQTDNSQQPTTGSVTQTPVTLRR